MTDPSSIRKDPWLTVITVHKNDHLNLRKTLKSLASQSGQNFECIIVDSSLDWQAFAAVCQEYPHLNLRVITENPQGIYSAMNSGLSIAKGSYVYFLNAGETLHSEKTLENLFEVVLTHNPDWVYGNLQVIDPRGRRRPVVEFNYSTERKKNFRAGRFPSQPASLVLTEILKELGGFDTSLQIAADYKLMLRLSQRTSPCYWNGTVVHFALGGISSRKWIVSLREAHSARREVFDLSRPAQVLDLVLSIPLYMRSLIARAIRRV